MDTCIIGVETMNPEVMPPAVVMLLAAFTVICITGLVLIIQRFAVYIKNNPLKLPKRQITVNTIEPQATEVIITSPVKQDIALAVTIPDTVPFPEYGTKKIKALYDGSNWYHIELGKDGHWGIFGTTGSGKGNLLQIIALAVLQLGPQKAHLVILDAKGGVDYSFSKYIEHCTLYRDDGNGMLKAGCEYIITEMERRIDLLWKTDTRNIKEYNKQNPDNQLPLFVVIVDEIADFSKSQREYIASFARMSRAAGGVLFVATQYPTVEVLPSQIQSNVTNRCVFRLPSAEYTPIALRRTKDESSGYEPHKISADKKGTAVLRQDSTEILARVPELTDERRQEWIKKLSAENPRKAVSDEESLLAQWQRDGVSKREATRRIYRLRNNIPEDTEISYSGDGTLYRELQPIFDRLKWA